MNTRFRNLLVGTAYLLFTGGVTSSCGDFLNTTPQGSLDATTLATHAGVEGTLIAAYRSLDHNDGVGGAWGNAASNWVWGSVASDDAYKGSNFGDQSPITDIELYNWTTADAESYLDDKWRQVWDGVVRSNATLRLLKSVVSSKPTEISASDQSGIRGEATFLRAHFEFEAWQMWGNVPYYYETDADFRKPNTGVNVIAAILADLDTAAAYLPATPRNGDAGRVTSWTAKAYKGRVQVVSGDYAGGLATLTTVKNSNVYALETSFDHVWTALSQYANGKETILAYQASANDGQPNGDNANWGERLNFPYSGSPFGCCGFHQPSQNLVNFYVVDSAGGLPTAFTGAAGAWNTRNAELNALATDSIWVDPRLDWTTGRDSVPFKDWGLHLASWIRDATYSGPYSPKKNIHEKACVSSCQSSVGWNSPQLNSVHIHIFRYADLLLLLAEAEANAGSLVNATADVNLVRARAGRTAQGCGTSSDTMINRIYPPCATSSGAFAVPLLSTAAGTPAERDSLIQPWARYRIGLYPLFASQATALQAIRYERRAELAMEGHRFFDLRRWGMDSVINNYVATEVGPSLLTYPYGFRHRTMFLGAGTFAARHHLYPIPQIEIDLSKVGTTSTLTQNPGW